MSPSDSASCPVHFDPFSADYLADPYPILGEMREQGGVEYSADLDMWVITRHQDVDAVFRDPDTFSAAIAQDPLQPLGPKATEILAGGFRPIRTMSNLDGPEHSRIRRHNQVGFSPARLRAMEPTVRSTAVDLIDATAGLSEVDLVQAFTYPLPASIIFALLGFPSQDTEMLKGWCGDRMSFSWGRPDHETQSQIATDMVAYWQYCEAHIERQVEDPGDNFAGDLIGIHNADPTTLSIAEITHIVYGLSFAGHETTSNLLSNIVRRLLEERTLWEAMVDDPTTIPGIVQEGLRHDSSVLAWRRVATTKTTLSGTEIPAGAKLLLMLGAANHDPDIFEEPTRFVPDRKNAAANLSFGKGKHYCLGATLAKLEAKVALEELARLRPGLRLADQEFTFPSNVSFRGPAQLMVTID